MTRRTAVAAITQGIPIALFSATDARTVKKVTGRKSLDFEPIRRQIQEEISSGRATGVSVAIARNGRIIWEEGFGWSDVQRGLKANSRTPFCLASITKVFTATLLMKLASSGAINLDVSANRYLGSDALRSPLGLENDATVRLLGAHASGLPTLFGMYPRDAIIDESFQKLLQENGTLAYPPGKVYEYSNVAYATLGLIASKVTQKPFGDLLTQSLLKPLGLRDSFFDRDTSSVSQGALLYDGHGLAITPYFSTTPPSGELYASAHDLVRFGMLHLKDRLKNEAMYLDDHFIDDLQSPVFTGQSGGSTTFGWFSGSTDTGIRALFKDGAQPGVSTLMFVVPDHNLTAVALTNRSGNGELCRSVVEKLIATVLPEWRAPNMPVSPRSVPLSETSNYAGSWTGTASGPGVNSQLRLQISADGNHSITIGDQKARSLEPVHTEGEALAASFKGWIGAADSSGVDPTLSLKLLLNEQRLTGRILQNFQKPNEIQIQPYLVDLVRI